ncbi:MAG: hypothetical protein RIS29_897, partial [Bacteroidota bacterium]
MMKKVFLSLLVFIFTGLSMFAGSKSVAKIDLKGKWAFEMDESDKGVVERWYLKQLTDSINLPGSMVENSKGHDLSLTTKFTGSIYDSSWFFNPKMEKYRRLDNLKMPFWLTQQKHYIGLAWYQKDIIIPANWKNKHISLFLEHPHFITR